MFQAEQTAEKYRRDRQKVSSEGSLICLEVTVRREICAVRGREERRIIFVLHAKCHHTAPGGRHKLSPSLHRQLASNSGKISENTHRGLH